VTETKKPSPGQNKKMKHFDKQLLEIYEFLTIEDKALLPSCRMLSKMAKQPANNLGKASFAIDATKQDEPQKRVFICMWLSLRLVL